MSKVKPWLLIAVIFLAGAVTGAALTMVLGPFFRHSPSQTAIWMQHLTQRLDLTPDQQAKIQPIVTDGVNQMQNVRKQQIEQMTKTIDAMNKAIAAILTPEQQEKLDKMEKEMDQNRDRMFPGHKHMWDHGGPGGPPGGPGQHWQRPPPGPSDQQTNNATPAPASSSSDH